ncbi:MAG: lytic transglycosylase domain-containing protein [Candidatus Coatesbacteria bacterium]|nr:lytic transglycosylase domain-containing protein [Candidatus Coatesbacteria bacterium]
MRNKVMFLIIFLSSTLLAENYDRMFDLMKQGKWIDALELYLKIPEYVKSTKYSRKLKASQKKNRNQFQSLARKAPRNMQFLNELNKVRIFLKTRKYRYPVELDNKVAVSLFVMVHSDRRSKTISILKARKDYSAYIRKMCRDMNLPEELEMIPAIESGYRKAVTSHAGAEGMWQLMESTAKDMDLKVNDGVDQRKDWKLSTAAALKFLKRLYGEYDSWEKTLSAYHWGPGNLSNSMKKEKFPDCIPDITKRYLSDFSAYVILSDTHRKIFSLY